MKKLVLLRHGESVWNKENRFTGWTDVDLSERGIKEAHEAGKVLKENGFFFDLAYTSFLKRAIKTLNIALEEMDQLWIPVKKSWRLNEKHYGNLQGLNKAEMAEKFGEEQVLVWRRSYDVPPAAVELNDERNPRLEAKYKKENQDLIPLTESLKETVERMVPYWEGEIRESLKTNNQILVAAHGNSLRAVIKYLKNISEKDIVSLNLPTGIPYVFEFDDQLNLLKDYFLGDEETIKKLMEEVANQGKSKK
ncbi:MAG: 2,3-diphosphoglycerate-dependent phosphoglycerate mutase [Lentimicrobium sp.]|nr:2,3-diphosphoglycerate-dependent phosphoglycerate mutase [Lentimicrobium sp.]